MNRLYFAANGTILLHATRKNITGWNIATLEQCCQGEGMLVGISRDGATILTCRNAIRQYASSILTRADGEPIRAWNVATGEEIEITSIKPDRFEPYQRTFILATNQRPLSIELHDALNTLPPQVIQGIGSRSRSLSFDEYLLAADNQSLIVTLSGEEAGHDWAEGECFSTVTGRLKYTFDVSRFSGLINLSVEHNLLVMSVSNGTFEIQDVTTGENRQTVKLPSDIQGGLFRIHPQNKNIIAARGERIVPSGSWPHYQNHLCLLKKTTSDSENISVASIMESDFEETGFIEDFIFYPNRRHMASVNSQGEICLWDLFGRLVGKLPA